MLSPDDLQLIRRLHLRLGRQVDAPFIGDYRSAFRGNGMEFEDVRAYVPGDDVRRIDWNVTARVGSPHIKEFREEREMCVMLVCDVSASMRFGSQGIDKRRQMARLAGALAFAAIRSGDRVGLLRFAENIETFVPPKKGRGHVWRVIQEVFNVSTAGKGTSLQQALQHLRLALKGRLTIVLLTDCWSPLSELQPLGALCLKHRVHAFVLHDPLEYAFPKKGLFYLQDSESGGQQLIDAAQYSSRMPLADRLKALRRYGAHARAVSTQDDPISTLLTHFRELERRQ